MKETRRQPIQRKTPELDEKIRQRAYELYEQRGRTEGLELEDWVQAEAEVLGSNDFARTA
jgi:hypothetical protein